MIRAIEEGDLMRLQQLLSVGVNPNYSEQYKPNALLYATQIGNLKATRLLLDNGARPQNAHLSQIFSTHSSTPCEEPRFEKIVALLLDRGVSANAENELKQTPIEIASEGCAIEVVSALLSKGADPNRFGVQSPLAAAAKRDRLDLVELLLKAGAHPSHPRAIPLQASFDPARHSETTTSIIKSLLNAGSSLDDKNSLARLVAQSGRVDSNEIMQLLLAAGATLPPPTQQELDEETKNASLAETIGRASLGMGSLSLGQLKKLFGEGILSHEVENAVTVSWHVGAIEAVFSDKSLKGGEGLPETIQTIRLRVKAPFGGSLGGVHLGDEIKLAVWNGISDEGYWKQLGPNHQLYAFLKAKPGRPLRVVTLEISDSRYMVWLK